MLPRQICEIKVPSMTGNVLEILKMLRFCKCFDFWNGYVRKENQRYKPSCPNVERLKPASPYLCAAPENGLSLKFMTDTKTQKCFWLKSTRVGRSPVLFNEQKSLPVAVEAFTVTRWRVSVQDPPGICRETKRPAFIKTSSSPPHFYNVQL